MFCKRFLDKNQAVILILLYSDHDHNYLGNIVCNALHISLSSSWLDPSSTTAVSFSRHRTEYK